MSRTALVLHTPVATFFADCVARGRSSEATVAACLRAAPTPADVLHLAGLQSLARGDLARAVRLLDRAVRLLGMAVRIDSPRIDSAHYAALNNLGVARLCAGEAQQAVRPLRAALALDPQRPEAHGNLGLALYALGEHDGADVALSRAFALTPPGEAPLPPFRRGLAELRLAQGRCDDAAAVLRAVLAADPADLDAWLGLGRTLVLERRWGEAEACFDRILALRPGHLGALCALAEVVGDERLDAVWAELHRHAAAAVDVDAQYRVQRALAILAQLRREVDAEAEHLARAIDYRPDAVEARVARAKLLLLRGDFAAGWSEFEWRWRQAARVLPPREFRRPCWRGEELGEAAILLHAEQGLGCMIQFARYAPLVAARGGRVVLEAPRLLVRLFQSLRGVAQVIAYGEPVPAVAWQCPLMSLPLAFQTTLRTIPAQVPYLAPDAAETRVWSKRLAGGFRVAVAWAGSPNPLPNNRRRSMPARALDPLGEIPGLSVVSLQHHAHDHSGPLNFPHLDLAPELTDFAVTAAVIANVDLVVTVDTALAHLAGALGKPVWILLPHAGEYRWLLARDDSPWYPTVRLFRQPTPGDWCSVVARVAAALRPLAADAARSANIARSADIAWSADIARSADTAR